MKKIFLLLIVATSFLFSASFQVEQWQVVDISVSTKGKVENPFDIEFGAKFTGPKKQSITVPGFYNGGKEWVVRFSTKEIGDWNYVTFSSDKKLAGRTGKILVKKNSDKNVHGGLILNPENPQHFYHDDGTPHIALAYEFDWLFALDYENDSGIPKSEILLKQLAENGINQLVMNVYAHSIKWNKDYDLKPEYDFGNRQDIFPFAGSNSNPDFSTLNIDFFKKFDRVIAAMNDHGILSHLMIYVWNKNVNWPDMNTWADNTYFDYVIKRYQAFPNIIWDVSKEALGYGRCDMPYITERIDRIRKNDVYNRLITVHDYHYCKNNPDKVDFISIQTWTTDLYNAMKNVRENFPLKTIHNVEHGGYEMGPYNVFPGGNYYDAKVCLRRNYECIFAGTYSAYYWMPHSWSVIVYDIENNPYGYDGPSLNYYKNLTDLFKRFDFSKLEPKGGQSTSGFCLTDNSDEWLYYIPKENSSVSFTIKKPDSGKISIQWFNTITGEYSDENVVEWTQWNWMPKKFDGDDAVAIVKVVE